MASGLRENPKGNNRPGDGSGPEAPGQGGRKPPFKKRSSAGGEPKASDETADAGCRKTPPRQYSPKRFDPTKPLKFGKCGLLGYLHKYCPNCSDGTQGGDGVVLAQPTDQPLPQETMLSPKPERAK